MVRVHLDDSGGAVPVGAARISRLRGVETTEFAYDDTYLSGPGWEISPDLPVQARRSIVEGLPGALDDSAPDSWGRDLITRRRAVEARAAGHVAATPSEVDYLLGVSDVTRQGALRFRLDDEQPFLAEGGEVPRLLDLDSLLAATTRLAGGGEADDAVELLLAAGSGSLGGARPKASVTDGTTLYIAKFPRRDDRWDVMRWEAVALDLADAWGLRTPEYRLVEVGRYPVLLIQRFDRDGNNRVLYLSARSLISARDGASRDYLEVVDGLTAHGSDVGADLVELWRRIAFSVAINNVDDHMRNHGFLRGRGGWTLAPIFDVNPDPRPGAPRASSIAGATTAEESRSALLASSDHFGLSPADAQQWWRQLQAVITGWRNVADRYGISDTEQDQFAPVFERWGDRH